MARDLDAVSLYHAAQLAVAALERASRDLAEAREPPAGAGPGLSPPSTCQRPFGRIVVAGAGNDRHGDCGDCLALVDLGGDDAYTGSVGAAFERPVSVALDLAGDDRYLAPAPGRPTQGAGLLGVGLLLDVAGNDRYEAEDHRPGPRLTSGWVCCGTTRATTCGRLRFSGQGAAYFGIGLLVDGAGDDVYDLWGDGQGFGGIGGGVGVLADRSGDDRYTAEIDAHITGRGSGHTRKRVTYSNAQGAANGRRGDLSDGHAWAGGLGALLDLDGDDAYEAGNWALGAGYWFGAGILYDGGGSDRYRSVYYSLASGAHFCLGAVFDDGDGDDTYTVWDPPIADDLVPAGAGDERRRRRRALLRLGLLRLPAGRQGRRRHLHGAHHLRRPGHDPLHGDPRRPRKRRRRVHPARGSRRRQRRLLLPRSGRYPAEQLPGGVHPGEPVRHELRLAPRRRGHRPSTAPSTTTAPTPLTRCGRTDASGSSRRPTPTTTATTRTGSAWMWRAAPSTSSTASSGRRTAAERGRLVNPALDPVPRR